MRDLARNLAVQRYETVTLARQFCEISVACGAAPVAAFALTAHGRQTLRLSRGCPASTPKPAMLPG